MRPGIRASVILQTTFLIGERHGEGLPGTDAADIILPSPSAAIVRHIDVLLALAGDVIVDDHIARRPAAGLEDWHGGGCASARHGDGEATRRARDGRGGRRRIAAATIRP